MNSGRYRTAMSNLSMLLQVRERVEEEVEASARTTTTTTSTERSQRPPLQGTFSDGAFLQGQKWGSTACGAGSVEWPLATGQARLKGFSSTPVDEPCRGPADQLLAEPGCCAASTRVIEGFAGPGPEVPQLSSTSCPFTQWMHTAVPEFCAGDAVAKVTSVPLCLTRSERR
jgi:hypothetical protein